MSKQANKMKSLALMVGLALAGIGGASAETINGGLRAGSNTLLDESRETYVDANSNGLFDIGDVIFGYIRISDFQPSGASGNNQVYGIFSQEIAAPSAGRDVFFKATTLTGYTLFDLTGNVNVGANAVAAFYDKNVSFTDLINVNPAPAANMQDYLDHIKTGDLRVVAGLDGVDDFLYSEITKNATSLGVGVGSSNAAFVNPAVDNNFTLANNNGAFSLLYEDVANYDFLDQTIINPNGGAAIAKIGITQGTTGGANGAAILPNPKGWLEAGGIAAQCSVPDGAGGFVDTACGFTNKQNFTVNVQRVPEPATLSLLGLGLLGMGAIARRRKSA